MAHHEFTTPLAEAQARMLRVNDTVTLNGALFGIRDRCSTAAAGRASICAATR
jgi:tartrate dehydratase beta subunit/fumarate hydratase class I family protein